MESTRTDWGSLRPREIAIPPGQVDRPSSVQEDEEGQAADAKTRTKRASFVRRCLRRKPSSAVRFGLRFSFGLTAASLFVLVPYPPGNTDGEYWPQGSWVFTTVVLCSWFPSQPVAASVVQKTYHRILGTTAGAALGLAVGFTVAALPDAIVRGVILGLVTSFVSFAWGFAAVQWKQLFGGYNYAAVLVLMTYGIVVWPFYLSPENDEIYKRGGYRIGNVLIGCVISGLSAILIFPKSTRTAIEEKEASQIRRAGMSSEAVLSAAMERFSAARNNDTTSPPPLRLDEIIREQIAPDGKDAEGKDMAVYDSYTAAVQEYIAARSLFVLLDYDPFHHLGCSFFRSTKEQQTEKMHESAVNLARSFRIQTTIVLLDSIIRNDEGHSFSAHQLEVFGRAGKIIKSILTERSDEKKREAAAFELASILAEVRQDAIDVAKQIQPLSTLSARTIHSGGLDVDEFVHQLENQHGGQPMCSQSATILFLELVEHLILRVLRLYFAGNLRLPNIQVDPTTNKHAEGLVGWEGDDDFAVGGGADAFGDDDDDGD